MQVVDSNKQKLTTPEIVIQTMESKTNTRDDFINAMRLLAKEGSMKNADTVQIGNTVFLAHRGKDKNKNKMVGGLFNVDTVPNFTENYIKYFQYLQNKNITHYNGRFSEDTLLPAAKTVQEQLTKADDSKMYLGTQDKEYVVYVNIGKDPIG